MFRSLDGPVGLILIVIVVAIFAGPKLPKAAKGIAESIKVFRKEIGSDSKSADSSAIDNSKSDSTKSDKQ